MSAPDCNHHYRTFGAYQSFGEADRELQHYWPSRTPKERMEALEQVRILNYGAETINAQIPRIFGVPELRGR
jgi:CMP-2-keto-3-deoxyoctulosonic acid synthetase